MTLDEARALIAAQQETIEGLVTENESLANRPAVVKSGIPTTIKGKPYLVKHGLFIEGKKVSAKELAANKKLLEVLLESKSSAIEAA